MDAPPTRKPYRITKQREKWTEDEHQRFLDAVDMYGRNWKEIVDHVGTRSVAQVRSHAQKYFLKLEKSGKASVVPPPRPKKRAAKPYPVQDRSEETRRRGDHSGGEARRRSKRGCHSSPASNSDASLPSTSRGGGAQAAITSAASPGTRSSMRSAGTAATTSGAPPARPVRSTRSTRSAALLSGLKGSSTDLEGNGSNNASTHGSNTERSSDPSADNPQHSGLSTSDLGYADDSELPSATVEDAQALSDRAEADMPAPDYSKLYHVVGSMFDRGGPMNDQNAQKQIIEQLEPNQRESLLVMMSQLTGNLRSSCDKDALLQQLQQQQQLAAADSGIEAAGQQLDEALALSSVNFRQQAQPAVAPLPPPQLNALDPAASMPLMPESLPMPLSGDEQSGSLQALPGQGTALLRSSFSAPAAQQQQHAAQSSQASNLSAAAAVPASYMGSAMPADSVQFPAAERPQSDPCDLDGQLFATARTESDLGTVLLMGPKEEPGMLRTPLDDCLAQLETGTAPSVPESEDFLDSWKIGSSDPVWQTLDMNASSGGAVVPASPINGSMFVF